MELVIGQVVSGTYRNKGFNRRGCVVPVTTKRFKDGVVIGHTKTGGAIIEVESGNLKFKVYRVKIDEVTL